MKDFLKAIDDRMTVAGYPVCIDPDAPVSMRDFMGHGDFDQLVADTMRMYSRQLNEVFFRSTPRTMQQPTNDQEAYLRSPVLFDHDLIDMSNDLEDE